MKAHQTGQTVTLAMTQTEARNLEDELLWCRSDDTYSKAVWEALRDLSDPDTSSDTTDVPRRVNELLHVLGGLLTPGHGEISRAYAQAQNSMIAKGGPAAAMEALATRLREAAAAADEIADLTRGR